LRLLDAHVKKVDWHSELVGVQPRIRLTRSFDQRTHSYLGYVLRLRGVLGGNAEDFVVAIGKAAQAKFAFRSGDVVEGKGVPVADLRLETAQLYQASALKLLERPEQEAIAEPPFHGEPPTLEVYRARGHRGVAARTY
jgi:hypothetical protein